MSDYISKLLIDLLLKALSPEMLEKLKAQFICWLQAEAMKSGTPLDDAAVKILAAVLKVDASLCVVPAK